MLKKAVLVLGVLVLAIPAFSYDTTWDGDPEGVITINADINCFIQILWQDVEIQFQETANDTPHDWWSWQLEGVGYTACPDPGEKLPLNPWAGDAYYCGDSGIYYESGDGAHIFVTSNNSLSMTVTTNGDLHGTVNDPNNKIPTWFTVCLAPFIIGGEQLEGTVPLDGSGQYLYEDPNQTGVFLHGDDSQGHNYPNQHAFSCEPAGTSWTLGPMPPYVWGTIKFLVRIHRHGMADAGDSYSTTLDVAFSTP